MSSKFSSAGNDLTSFPPTLVKRLHNIFLFYCRTASNKHSGYFSDMDRKLLLLDVKGFLSFLKDFNVLSLGNKRQGKPLFLK